MPRTGAAIKWPGGKTYLARKIVSMFPRHLHYAEPFLGAGAVLFERDPDDESLWLDGHRGVSEIVNDTNLELTNFWRVLQHPATFELFRRRVEAIPMSRLEFNEHAEPDGEAEPPGRMSIPVSVEHAVSFFVRCRQSRSGMMRDFTSPTRTRTRRQMNGNVSEWLGAVEGLPDVHERLRRVFIEGIDGVRFIEREDTENTLFYIDPPYHPDTVATPGLYGKGGEDGSSLHERLMEALPKVKGMFILSGYRNPLYDAAAARCGWNREDIDIANHLAGGDRKRRMTESLWTNY